jgi:peptidoglycan/LPS O-acetylase OafA/YrhL
MESKSEPASHPIQPMRIADTFAMKQGLMGFAALWIFVYHIWQPMFGSVPVLGRLESIVKYVGFAGVDLFFFLSGGGLVFSIQKGNVWSFYKRRVERILIPYLIMAVCYALYQHWSVGLFFARISGVYFYKKSMYGFLWYVPAILTLYLLFPAYYALFSRSRHQSLFLLIVLALWLALSILLKNTLRGDLYGFTNRIPIFLIGVNCGQKMKDGDDVLPRWFPFAAVGMLLLGVFLAYLTNVMKLELLFPVSNAAFPNMLLTLGMAFLIPWVSKRVIRRELPPVRKFFGFFGTISLAFYCTQELLYYVYRDVIGLNHPALDNLALIVLITAASLLLSKVSDWLLQLCKRISPSKKTVS